MKRVTLLMLVVAACGDDGGAAPDAPGTYWACAGFFDIATMGAFARPFGCSQVVIRDGDNVRDVSVPLS